MRRMAPATIAEKQAEAQLEQFVLQGQSASCRARAAADLIEQATSAPGLFAFGELLDLDNIKEVRNISAFPTKLSNLI